MRTSQKDQVAHLLRARGAAGVHTFELRQAFIANPSERIRELQDHGWVIEHKDEKLHGKATGTRYVKVSEPATPDSPVARVSTDSPSQESLFDVPSKPHWADAA
jgi:hypothetical protein